MRPTRGPESLAYDRAPVFPCSNAQPKAAPASPRSFLRPISIAWSARLSTGDAGARSSSPTQRVPFAHSCSDCGDRQVRCRQNFPFSKALATTRPARRLQSWYRREGLTARADLHDPARFLGPSPRLTVHQQHSISLLPGAKCGEGMAHIHPKTESAGTCRRLIRLRRTERVGITSRPAWRGRDRY